jgi:hypothetical protein
MIQKGQVFAGCMGQRRIACFRDVAIGFSEDDLDPGILTREIEQQWSNMGRGGSIVRNARLPIWVSLPEDRLDGLGQQVRPDVEDRQENGDSCQIGNLL